MAFSEDFSFADVRETHVGAVLLVGDLAIKVKKPVRTGFLDFSTAARRRAACQREIDLNRRLAPDVYLGLVDLPGPDGTTCDSAVVMRRMPDDRRLSRLAEAGAPLVEPIEQLGVMIAEFHRTALRGPEITAEGGQRAVLHRWESNFTELRRYWGIVLDPAVLEDIEQRVDEFVAGRGPLFGERQHDGRIVDGHGDLLTDDIFCLADGPRVLDCLEFDDHLRYVDGVDDAAFLAMDLEHHGRADLAATFLDRYLDLAADPAPRSLLHHYIAYRALVRAKVACIRHEQNDPRSADVARDLLALAHRHICDASLRVVVIGGAPGTGKSTLAAQVAERTGAALFSSDVVRKTLRGLDPLQSAAAGLGEGIYDPQTTHDTYGELVRQASDAVRHGRQVVLDASWAEPAHRQLAADLARDTHSTLLAVRCTAPRHVVEERLRNRRPGTSASDADLAIGRALAGFEHRWPTALEVDTDRPLGAVVEDVLEAYHERDPSTGLAERTPR